MKRSAHDEMLTGKSVRAQLTSVHQHNGLVLYTFWYDGTTTRIDGWGHTKTWVSDTMEQQMKFYEMKAKQGYTIVKEFSTHQNEVDEYRLNLFGCASH